MGIIRYILLALIVWSIPTFFLDTFGGSLGSLSSYFMFCLLLLYYFLINKGKIIFPFILLGCTYYLISGLVQLDDFNDFIVKFLKYIILIIAGAEIIRNVDIETIFIFLIIGGLSIIANSVFFQDDYGRYSGFYLNPNSGALLALIGYSFCFGVKNPILKTIGLFVFTFAGILTFSRFFIIMWPILSIISVLVDKKNAPVFAVGFGTLILLVSIAAFLQLNTYRLVFIESVSTNQVDKDTTFFSQGSRFDTWSVYYQMIYDRLFFGHGYHALSGLDNIKVGVHNSLLLTVGEAGVIPFFLMVYIYIKLSITSLLQIKNRLYLVLLSLSLSAYLFVSHNFYDNYIMLLFSLWAVIKLKDTLFDEVPLDKVSIDEALNV